MHDKVDIISQYDSVVATLLNTNTVYNFFIHIVQNGK